MQLGKEEVEKGKELALKAGGSIEDIIKGAEKVSDIITQVAAASEEQSSASEEIGKILIQLIMLLRKLQVEFNKLLKLQKILAG